MNRPVSETAPRAMPRRSWRRTFLQFSLRTLLGVTTLAAVGCWWFLQPKMQEEELAGQYLTLRRQVRPGRDTDFPPWRTVGRKPSELQVSEGHWQLHSERGNLLVGGRYDRDHPSGKWTIYYTNGRKAAEGPQLAGARHGLWRTWYESGQIESECTYQTQPVIFRRYAGLLNPDGTLPPAVQAFSGSWPRDMLKR